MIEARLPDGRIDPDRTLVHIQVRDNGTCNWHWTYVTLREAWITHQPGLVPPPGRNAS